VQPAPLVELRVHLRVGRIGVGAGAERGRAGRPWIVVAVVSASVATALNEALNALL
jgi:hypothetical protein